MTGDVAWSIGSFDGSANVTAAGTIGANIVTFPKFVAATQAAFVGATAAGNFGELTPTQATAQLNVFSSTLKGLVPLSGGGTTNFLRADGTWAAPTGGGGGGSGTVTGVSVATANGISGTVATSTTTPVITLSLGAITPTSITGMSTPLSVAQGGTGNAGGAWTAYTPTVSSGTGTLTAASATGAYRQIGKTVYVRISISVPTNGTASGNLQVSLPAAAAGTYQFIGGRENGVTGYLMGGAIIGSTAYLQSYNGAYPASDGASIQINGVYEAS